MSRRWIPAALATLLLAFFLCGLAGCAAPQPDADQSVATDLQRKTDREAEGSSHSGVQVPF